MSFRDKEIVATLSKQFMNSLRTAETISGSAADVVRNAGLDNTILSALSKEFGRAKSERTAFTMLFDTPACVHGS
jgi:hypothetical protein